MPDNARTVTVRRVTPAAFAAWLYAQGQEPSVHVLAWFKHKGVAWPPVTASGGDAAPALRAEDVQDFAGVVQYRLAFNHLPAQQRPEWLPKHVEIQRTEVERPGSGDKAGAGRSLQISATAVGEALKPRSKPEPATPGPFAGLGARRKAP